MQIFGYLDMVPSLKFGNICNLAASKLILAHLKKLLLFLIFF